MTLTSVHFAGDRKDFICELCRDKSVLHLGCTAAPDTLGRLDRGEHLHACLSRVTKDLHGIDIDSKGLEILRGHRFQNLHRGNVEELQHVSLEKRFDMIVAAEIIEHLYNPMQMLLQAKRFMNRDSALLITMPNALSIKFFLHATCGREISGPDHTAIFSPNILERLLQRAGFALVGTWGVIDSHSKWRNRLSRPVFEIAFRLAPWFSDGLVVLARLNEGEHD